MRNPCVCLSSMSISIDFPPFHLYITSIRSFMFLLLLCRLSRVAYQMCIEWECEHEKFNGIKIVTSKKLRVKWTQKTHRATEIKRPTHCERKNHNKRFFCVLFFSLTVQTNDELILHIVRMEKSQHKSIVGHSLCLCVKGKAEQHL